MNFNHLFSSIVATTASDVGDVFPSYDEFYSYIPSTDGGELPTCHHEEQILYQQPHQELTPLSSMQNEFSQSVYDVPTTPLSISDLFESPMMIATTTTTTTDKPVTPAKIPQKQQPQSSSSNPSDVHNRTTKRLSPVTPKSVPPSLNELTDLIKLQIKPARKTAKYFIDNIPERLYCSPYKYDVVISLPIGSFDKYNVSFMFMDADTSSQIKLNSKGEAAANIEKSKTNRKSPFPGYSCANYRVCFSMCSFHNHRKPFTLGIFLADKRLPVGNDDKVKNQSIPEEAVEVFRSSPFHIFARKSGKGTEKWGDFLYARKSNKKSKKRSREAEDSEQDESSEEDESDKQQTKRTRTEIVTSSTSESQQTAFDLFVQSSKRMAQQTSEDQKNQQLLEDAKMPYINIASLKNSEALTKFLQGQTSVNDLFAQLGSIL